ncbi:sugar ABC transporter permease [Vibrio sinensis]|uniref:Sugar ABC transporter permease n=1 Tax=Vibrio sinensis TaxID=2302434 RepID=A0A3A6R401_9VIBR|nr:sugar ABC transporter permease [Vibrio sinensis]RJX75669.1 sugar ABC transporter permease [Vibrio sinensis]
MNIIRKKLLDSKYFDVALIAIPVVFLLCFSGLPLLYNIIISFQEVSPLSLGDISRPFVGLDNFFIVFEDPDFLLILKNTLVFVLASVFFQFVIAFTIAMIFFKGFPGSDAIRGLFLVPWIMPQLVIGAVWGWMFAGDSGIINYLLMTVGIIDQPIFWLSDFDNSLTSVIIANIWLGIPFNMIMLSVALNDISKETLEAAHVDGANPFQQFFYIIVPLIKVPIISVISLGIIFTLQQFDLFMALTQGGPSNSSNVLQLWSWTASFNEFEFGKGAAISVIILLIMLISCVAYVLCSRNEIE